MKIKDLHYPLMSITDYFYDDDTNVVVIGGAKELPILGVGCTPDNKVCILVDFNN